MIILSMKNATSRLRSAFKAQNSQMYQEMIENFVDQQPFLKRKIHEIGYTTLSLLCSFLFLGIIYIFKCSNKKLYDDLDILHEVIQDVLIKT